MKILIELFALAVMFAFDVIGNGTWNRQHAMVNFSNYGKRIYRVTYRNGYFSEIVYKGDCRLDKAVAKWKTSPTHKEILEDGSNRYAVMVMLPIKGNKCVLVVDYYKK